MSLALVQGYSSEEEVQHKFSDSESEEDDYGGSPVVLHNETPDGGPSSVSHPPLAPTHGSVLPSAAEVFSEVIGPPDFLKDSMGAMAAIQSGKFPHGSKTRTKKPLPAGAVVEAKPQVDALHDHVQSDAGNKKDDPRKPPPTEDAAKLLGMCEQCSVPKTYSAAKERLICPICKDRPAMGNDGDRKRGSRVKDKEKSKRMKGQSSHATWKSETEMQLRQQFD